MFLDVSFGHLLLLFMLYLYLHNHSALFFFLVESFCHGIQKVTTWLGVEIGTKTLKMGFCFKIDISVFFLFFFQGQLLSVPK